jgi:hypothetical protein
MKNKEIVFLGYGSLAILLICGVYMFSQWLLYSGSPGVGGCSDVRISHDYVIVNYGSGEGNVPYGACVVTLDGSAHIEHDLIVMHDEQLATRLKKEYDTDQVVVLHSCGINGNNFNGVPLANPDVRCAAYRRFKYRIGPVDRLHEYSDLYLILYRDILGKTVLEIVPISQP